MVWPRAGGPTAEWPKASLLCGTQVTRVRIDGEVGYSICRATRNCQHKALLSSSGPDSKEKDSQMARRLHTVGFSLARAGGLIASLRAEWPKASLLCGTQVTRVRIDGGARYSFIRQANISYSRGALPPPPQKCAKNSKGPPLEYYAHF